MRPLRGALAVVLGVTAWGLATGLQAGDPAAGASGNPWRDPAIVEARFGEAVTEVEEACGAKFQSRPSAVISLPAALVPVVRAEVLARRKATGVEGEPKQENLHLRGWVARYDAERNVVHVVPANADLLHSQPGRSVLATLEGLRLVLAREAVRALDHERFSFPPAVPEGGGMDAALARSALAEGHALFVVEGIARKWGLTPQFEAITAGLWDASALIEGAEDAPYAIPTVRAFPWKRGPLLFQAVFRERGVAGIGALLESPPLSTRAFDDPELWLHPERLVGEPDLDGVLRAIRPLFGDPAWKVDASRAGQAYREGLAAASPDLWQGVFAGCRDGRWARAYVENEPARVLALVFLYEDEEASRRAVRRHRENLLGLDPGDAERTADGAGPAGRLPGWVNRTPARRGRAESTLHIGSIGRVVVALSIRAAPELDRAAQDQAFARAEAFLSDPAAARAAWEKDPPAARPHSRMLAVALVDPEGNAVPRARGMAYLPGGVRLAFDIVDGGGNVPLPMGAEARLGVWEAKDAEGRPLSLAPTAGIEVVADATTVKVVLERGATISGEVIDYDGTPIPGVTVAAVPGWVPRRDARLEEFAFIHGRAVSGPDGRYKIVGLADDEQYTLFAYEEGTIKPVAFVQSIGGIEDEAVEVARGKGVPIRVAESGGKPVPGARVRVRQRMPILFGEPEIVFDGVTGEDGAVRALVPSRGIFVLQVLAPDAGDLDDADPDCFWSPSAEDVVLRRGRPLRGSVVDATGSPLRATVFRGPCRDGFHCAHYITGEDGKFRLGSARDPSIRLLAVEGATDSLPDEAASGPWTAVPEDKVEGIVLRAWTPPPKPPAPEGK